MGQGGIGPSIRLYGDDHFGRHRGRPRARSDGTVHTSSGFRDVRILGYSGLPCPACGWTTSFALVAKGQVITAWFTQPFGVILAVSTGVGMIVSGMEAVSPRDRWALFHGCFKAREIQFVRLLFAAMFAAWAFKITQKVIFLSPAA